MKNKSKYKEYLDNQKDKINKFKVYLLVNYQPAF